MFIVVNGHKDPIDSYPHTTKVEGTISKISNKILVEQSPRHSYMEKEIYFEGVKCIPAAEAASFVGLTRDHISRLCKSGKITGKFIGKYWYVSEKSLHEFAILYHYQKALRKDALARERKEGYKSAASIRELTPAHTPTDVTERLLHALSAPAGVSDAMIATAHRPA